MKQKFIFPILSFLILIAVGSGSCKKEQKGDTTGNTNANPKDSVVIIKTDVSGKDTLQDIVKDAETKLDFFFYGKRGSDAKLSAFTSVVLRKRNSPDTSLNMLLDDSSRIKAYYTSIKGVNDSSLYTIGYNVSGDSISVCRYLVDWSSGSRILRKQIKMKKLGTVYTVTGLSDYRLMGWPLDDLDALREVLSKIITIGGSVILIASAGLAGTGISGPLCGLAASLGVASILFDGINSANASELPPGTPFNIGGQQIFVTTTKDILQAHTWRYESKLNNGANDLSPCELDDFFTFNQNGTLTENTNINQCFFGEPNAYTYTWSLYNNDQAIRIGEPSGSGGYINMNITKLGLDRIEMSGYDDLGESWQYIFKTF
jgi:hypothetical protein